MSDLSDRSGELLNRLKSHLAIVAVFSDLLITQMPESDPRYAHAVQIRAAAHNAMALVPELSRQMK
jgi:hypothetical protein